MELFPSFFSVGSLLVYRKTADFCKLILSCYFSKAVYGICNFMVKFSGSFRYKIMSSSNRDILTSSFPI
jgi:hypothetical protein